MQEDRAPKKGLHAHFSVDTLTHSEQRTAIAQSMKAGEWMRDCEELLHPDTENVSWVTQGAAGSFQPMVLIFRVRVAMNHKCFPLQSSHKELLFSYIKCYHNVNNHTKQSPRFCRGR